MNRRYSVLIFNNTFHSYILQNYMRLLPVCDGDTVICFSKKKKKKKKNERKKKKKEKERKKEKEQHQLKPGEPSNRQEVPALPNQIK